MNDSGKARAPRLETPERLTAMTRSRPSAGLVTPHTGYVVQEAFAVHSLEDPPTAPADGIRPAAECRADQTHHADQLMGEHAF